MAKLNQPKALFFDIFGTCVDWRKTVTETLIDAAKQAGDSTMVQLINLNSQPPLADLLS
jgi:FMN phosphatase YigB (HAD superfamily)